MASLGLEPFDFEADREVAKMMRASARAADLHIRRAEYARARDELGWARGPRNMGFGAAARLGAAPPGCGDRPHYSFRIWRSKNSRDAKPHHSLRAAARTCLAKGVVETQADMPSIRRMAARRTAKPGDMSTCRKPTVAPHVHAAKATDEKAAGDVRFDLDDAETTADEGDALETESPEASPLCGPEEAPRELAADLGAWPALPSTAAADKAEAASGSRPSHREVARRFVEESLEERAAAGRSRAKRAAAARAAREASLWKPSWSKRRQRLAKGKAGARAAPQARGDAPPTPLDFEADLGDVKLARAAARHRGLHIKRSELARARDGRDIWRGKGSRDARPHHALRAAARTSLAQGAVETQADMPSIVRMAKPGDKSTFRKPAVSHMMQGVRVHDDTFEEVVHDSAPVIDEDEVADAASSESCDGEWQKLEATTPGVEAKKTGCAIS